MMISGLGLVGSDAEDRWGEIRRIGGRDNLSVRGGATLQDAASDPLKSLVMMLFPRKNQAPQPDFLFCSICRKDVYAII